MRRRAFITLLGGAAVAPSLVWPLAARAQQAPRLKRIGVMGSLPLRPIESPPIVLVRADEVIE